MIDPAQPEADPDGSDDDRPLVLLVGEDPGVRAELSARVSEGYRVEEAAGAGEAAALAARLQADLVVTDYTVADEDAVRLLQTLRSDADLGATPIILLSLGTPEAADALGLASGFGHLLTDWQPPTRRPLPTAATGHSRIDEAFLTDAIGTVRSRMSEAGFGTSALAIDLGLSPRQLRRRLVALAGETPAQLIRRVRLGAAAELLLGGARVKEVAGAVGFASTSGFRSAFSATFGVSPSSYAADQAGARREVLPV